jgi:23S rRNA pseudoU1915 N3-methylase RlmH
MHAWVSINYSPHQTKTSKANTIPTIKVSPTLYRMRTAVHLPVLLCMLTRSKGVAGFLPGQHSYASLLRRRLAVIQQQRTRSNAVPQRGGGGGGLKVNIRIVGRKQSEPWIEDGCEMYETRMRANGVIVETTWHKDNAALVKNVVADWDKKVPVVLLDPLGKSMTSEMFAERFYRWIEDGGSRLVLVIGGGKNTPAKGENRSTIPANEYVSLFFT